MSDFVLFPRAKTAHFWGFRDKGWVAAIFSCLNETKYERFLFWKHALIGRLSHLTTPPPLPSHRGFKGVLYTTVLLPSHARFKGVLILSDSLLFFAQALYAGYLCFATAIPVYFDSHRKYTGIFLRTFL